MTDQYQQRNINLDQDREILEQMSFDERDVTALVPAGTTATYRKFKMPVAGQLTRISWSAVLAPGGGETVQLRLYRVRPVSNPAGFGYIQLNNTYTISASNFTGAGNDIDFSETIRPDLCVFPGEYLAASWVHAGAQTMQPLNMNWNFTPIGVGEVLAEPDADTVLYADVFG